MNSSSKNKIKKFGNPTAYYENLLFHKFSDRGKEDLYYQLVFYGLDQKNSFNVPLDSNFKNLLSRVIKHQQKRISKISEFIHSTRNPGLWLDMGCGVGQFLNQISQLKSSYSIGTDISLNVLKKANVLLKKCNPSNNYCLVNQDLWELPFKDKTFDYILSADVLEHVGYNKQKKVISEIYRVLKKGGQVVIHTPNLNRVIFTTFLKKIVYSFKGFNPLYIKHSFPGGHISLTSPNKLKKICKSVGFETRIYQQADWKLSSLYKWAFIGLNLLFFRSFILVLSKKIQL